MAEFVKFPKIPRLRNVLMSITEKIDGTNAQINIPQDPSEPLLVGSRNRIITPGKDTDNYGFAGWVAQHEAMLRRLGPGRHYGEWWGAGVARKYGLEEKRFSLFNVGRYSESGLPEGAPVSLVPVLYYGEFSMQAVYDCLEKLKREGSVAAPGFMQPEGVVVKVGEITWKEILDKTGPSPEE
jgi:hypothetical protein